MTMSCVAERERRQKSEPGDVDEIVRGIEIGNCQQCACDTDLRQQHPAATATENGRQARQRQVIDERGPDELQRIQDADPREHADLGHADIRSRQPGGERAGNEQKRQTGGEAEKQHGQHPRMQVNAGAVDPGSGGGAVRRVASQDRSP